MREVRPLHGGLALELRGGDKPGLVLVQGSARVIVELAHVKTVIAAMGDAAADLVGRAAGWRGVSCLGEGGWRSEQG